MGVLASNGFPLFQVFAVRPSARVLEADFFLEAFVGESGGEKQSNDFFGREGNFFGIFITEASSSVAVGIREGEWVTESFGCENFLFDRVHEES